MHSVMSKQSMCLWKVGVWYMWTGRWKDGVLLFWAILRIILKSISVLLLYHLMFFSFIWLISHLYNFFVSAIKTFFRKFHTVKIKTKRCWVLRWKCWWALDLTILILNEGCENIVLNFLQTTVKTLEWDMTGKEP